MAAGITKKMNPIRPNHQQGSRGGRMSRHNVLNVATESRVPFLVLDFSAFLHWVFEAFLHRVFEASASRVGRCVSRVQPIHPFIFLVFIADAKKTGKRNYSMLQLSYDRTSPRNFRNFMFNMYVQIPCLFITLIQCLKGHKSLGLLLKGVLWGHKSLG